MAGSQEPAAAAVLLLLLLAVAAAKSGEETAASQQKQRETLIQHAVQRLLGMKQERSSREGGNSPPPPPPYMLELYEKYRREGATGTRGNTVRSIVAARGEVRGEDLLLFNLSGIHESEALLRAELHLFKRRPKKRSAGGGGDRQDSRLRVNLVSGEQHETNALLGSVEIPEAARRGWQTYDITGAVKELRMRQPDSNHQLLGAMFEMRTNGRKGETFRRLPARRFLKHHSHHRPFLIVFSNDSDVTSALDDLAVGGGQSDNEDDDSTTTELNITAGNWRQLSSFSSSPLSEILYASRRRDRRDAARWERSIEDNRVSEEDFSTERSHRSVLDNELPDDLTSSHRLASFSNAVPNTHPSVLQGRLRQQQQQQQQQPQPPPQQQQKQRVKNDTDDSSTLLIPRRPTSAPVRPFGPKSGSRTPGGPKRRGRQRHLPRSWQHRRRQQDVSYTQRRHENDATLHPPEEQRGALCQRRKLVVDFAEIGWSEWIISPKMFQAHYCYGTCPFPLTKGLRPTNHATIQSLVNAIGLHPEVPSPCCVPDVMSSITLLFFDEDRNVVLKNYPSMTVENCACR